MLPDAPPETTPANNLECRVLALGREGCGRAEIAEALGVSAAELRALEDGRPGFRAAMARAEGAARAWWEASARAALAAGVRSGLGGWRAAMQWRFGAAQALEARAAAAAAAAAEEAARRERVRIELPDNGRDRSSLRYRDPAAWGAAERARLQAEIAELTDALENARTDLELVDVDLAELAGEDDADEPGED
jgi:hypothetical protein